ncbi:LytR/AlgR family response regulator transcription factor [Aurantibacillus circumpalustris]|uniref:LytR/AlgR family response regulator transcription factor n=1 Tax=Aurantibacillus circumpalustris TaxID=3036359 RepID=UPI00295AE6DC|nr:LytTR family DNA-binding domain-containing protein [Aurantibacillus circumpalustris]
MKAIIIEDEKLSAEHLSNLLRKIDPSIEIVANYDTVKKSIDSFKKGVNADLLFVDVHLADGISFDIFSKVAVETPIIFTTAYDEYAIKAFKTNSIDYLLKPIGLADLKSALEKYKKFVSLGQSVILENISNAYQNLNKQFKSRFMVKMGDTISTVKSEDISYFISEDGVVLLIKENKRYVIDYTLDNLETLISPDIFFRINRKVLLNISSIKKVSPYFNSRLKLNIDSLNEEDGVVSRERVNDFKAWLDK